MREVGVPSGTWVLLYAVAVVVGGFVAALTFEPAIETGISLIQTVATLDVSAFDFVDFVLMIIFFISFSAATHSLDRLVIGGVRAILPG
jgi:hypothetical protein